jgi:hypothetical protein
MDTDACLPRALALLPEVRRLGFAADIELGVRKDGDRVTGHAWLVWNGAPVLEAPDVRERYAPLERP